MGYLYETHMHTCLSSKCGTSTGKEHVRFYLEHGYTGIIITDHFYGGNTSVDRQLPWEQFVDAYWRGYEDAWEEGQRLGLDVFFGIEQNYAHDEYLIYGLSREYMKAHPEMRFWTRQQQLDEVHKAGGCVIQAHPFRIKNYMDRIRLASLFSDGVEVANAGNDALDDSRCMRYATERKLVMTAGSDNHHSIGEKLLFGVELNEKLKDIRDYVRILLNREPIGLHVPPERFTVSEPELDDRHLAYYLNEQEEDVLSRYQWNV